MPTPQEIQLEKATQDAQDAAEAEQDARIRERDARVRLKDAVQRQQLGQASKAGADLARALRDRSDALEAHAEAHAKIEALIAENDARLDAAIETESRRARAMRRVPNELFEQQRLAKGKVRGLRARVRRFDPEIDKADRRAADPPGPNPIAAERARRRAHERGKVMRNNKAKAQAALEEAERVLAQAEAMVEEAVQQELERGE